MIRINFLNVTQKAKLGLSSLKQFLVRWLKRDGIAIFFFGLATIIMSYPLILRLGGDWVSESNDAFMKLWDIWWLNRILTMDQEIFYTRELFYPSGVSLVFHSQSWTTSGLSWLLIPITGSILSAYKVTILIGILAVAYSAYLLVLELTQNRSAAWLGGTIYAYAPFIITHSKSHPDVSFTVTIPIATLLIIRAIRNNSIPVAIGAGLTVGLAAFTSMYVLTFVAFTVGFICLFLMFEDRRWHNRQFWKVISIFTLVMLLSLGIRFFPWFVNLEDMIITIDSAYEPTELQADLLALIIPSTSHEIFEPFVSDLAKNFRISEGQPPYLGIVPIVLTFSALTWKDKRRDVWPWFGIGLFFLLLSLGSVLRVNGQHYEQVPMLLTYLDWLAPLRGVRTNFFHVGLLLPLAVCSAFGLSRWLKTLEKRRIPQIILFLGVTVLLLFEYWNGPYPLQRLPINQFYTDLSQSPDEFAIIQLPMGRQISKKYLFLQTFHQKPIAEGVSARTPNEVYQYIHNNPLLVNWLVDQPIECQKLTRERLVSAVNQLIKDNFRFVIIHHPQPETFAKYENYFLPEPFYQDSELTVFRVADLRHEPSCQPLYDREFDLPTPEVATSIQWDQKISLLGYDIPDVNSEATMLPIRVYWQANDAIENSYIAYFHLKGVEADEVIAQADVIPRGWSYPTTWWTKGEVVEDTINLPIENVPPGRYEIRIGWYEEETGLRLPVESDKFQPDSEGSILLAEIEF